MSRDRLLAALVLEHLRRGLPGGREHRQDHRELARGERRERELAAGDPALRAGFGGLRRRAPAGRAARSSSTAAGVSAGSDTSPPLPAAPVCTSTANTPNARCNGPWWTSSASIRASGTTVSFSRTIPVWWWIASGPIR